MNNIIEFSENNTDMQGKQVPWPRDGVSNRTRDTLYYVNSFYVYRYLREK